MSTDRRDNLRVPDCRLITEIVYENPRAASIVNVSPTGLFTVKPIGKGVSHSRLIQIEIPVPEASDSIWATGEIVFEKYGQKAVGSGIRFVAMANGHRSMLRDLVESRRHQILGQMMQEIRWRKELALHPSPFTAPPPPIREETVRMYLLNN